MFKIPAAAILFLLSFSTLADSSYLCISEMGAGFFYDKKAKIKWSASSINPKSKYIISKPNINGLDKDYAWVITEIGEKNPFMFCKNDFGESGLLQCQSLYDFRMSRENGRFILIYPIGYWSDNMNAKIGERLREGDDMPHMLAGKCSPL